MENFTNELESIKSNKSGEGCEAFGTAGSEPLKILMFFSSREHKTYDNTGKKKNDKAGLLVLWKLTKGMYNIGVFI